MNHWNVQATFDTLFSGNPSHQLELHIIDWIGQLFSTFLSLRDTFKNVILQNIEILCNKKKIMVKICLYLKIFG